MGEYQNSLVKADTERLLEVLQNIIENAIKYGSGKKIGISISKEEDCVLIRGKYRRSSSGRRTSASF